MATVYTIGNINLQTVNLVAKAIKETEADMVIDKLVIFDSEKSEKIQNDQVEIYRKYFGDFVREGVRIEKDGSIPANVLMQVFSGGEEKIVDLTNGQKVTSSLLFMAANLCKIEKIYYLMLKGAPQDNMVKGIDYDYIKIRKIEAVRQLAKISYFDLIYYNDELNQLFTQAEIETNTPLKKIYDGMRTGIKDFFAGSNYRSVVNNVTIGNEIMIKAYMQYLLHDNEARHFCEKNGIKINTQKDPIGALTFFAKKYREHGSNKKFLALVTVPTILSSVREYRNVSAHYTNSKIELTEDTARLVINLVIEALKCARCNNEYWGLMKNSR